MRGVDVVTAFALACEVDGFSRFRNASAFSSWLGTVPSENSSADKQRRGGITKPGNKHLRKMLVESAWHHYRLAGRGGKTLCKGQVVSVPVKRHAGKGCRRLKERFDDLVDSGKRPVVANRAIARELACRCWAPGKMAESAQPQRAGISARSRDRQKRGPAANCAAA